MSELDTLQAALAGEHAAIYGYEVMAARSDGALRTRCGRAVDSHRSARDRLIALLTRQGAEPVAAEPAYAVRATDGAAEVSAFATGVEQRQSLLYGDVVEAATGPSRGLGIAGVQETASAAAAWSGQAQTFPGLDPPGDLRTSRGPRR